MYFISLFRINIYPETASSFVFVGSKRVTKNGGLNCVFDMMVLVFNFSTQSLSSILQQVPEVWARNSIAMLY